MFKRRVILLTVVLQILLNSVAFGEDRIVTISHCSIPVKVNYINLDNAGLEYPMIMYKDIVYLALDTSMCNVLGFELNAGDAAEKAYVLFKKENLYEAVTIANLFPRQEPKGFKTSFSATTPRTPNPYYREDFPDTSSNTAEIFNGKIYVNGMEINNQEREYPFLIYLEQLYLPLDWDTAMKLGLYINYTPESGLEIMADSRFFDIGTETERLICDDLCVVIKLQNDRAVPPVVPTQDGLKIAKNKGSLEEIYTHELYAGTWMFGYSKYELIDADENIPSLYNVCGGRWVYNSQLEISNGSLYINATRYSIEDDKTYRLKVDLSTYEITKECEIG